MKREVKRPTKGPWRPQGKPGTYVTAILGALVVLLVAVACLLTWTAFNHSGAANAAGAETVSAPLPKKEFSKPAGGKAVGPTGKYPVAVKNAKGTETMTTKDMAPNTLFIPALGVYMSVEADTAFVESAYEGFDTLRIPKNAWHGVWYGGGAPMSGGQQGVTMIAAHVSTTNGWGALRRLHTLTGGEMIYTKDAKGDLQSWQMTQMRVEKHTKFPQEYWSAEGERRLVVTTCGGTVNSRNLFMQNIFAVAEPVDPLPQPVTA